MIPYASCMCFSAEKNPVKRRRQWTVVAAQKGTSMILDKENAFCIRFKGSIDTALSRSELCMLEAMCRTEEIEHCLGPRSEQGVHPCNIRNNHQPVITQLLEHHLLDDTYGGVTKILLSKCNSWSFNTFNLDVCTGGRSLSYLLVHLFEKYGFIEHFQLDIVKIWHCFNLMEAAYHRHNPYHNSVHAADVTQAMHCFLQENKFSAHLTPVEAMSAVIAAVAHDLDHPGVTQAFLVATSNHLVNLYHNSSVLENHHWRTAVSCLSESGIFNHLDKDTWLDIQRQIRSLILATDITRQKEFLAKFKNYLNSECLDMEKIQYRHFALQIALKCADLCNPCRPWAISQRWSYQVCQEFYRQGAYERQLKLPLTPTFDCSRTKVAKIQADFFQFVVSPLFETWDHFLKTPLSSKLLENLKHNFTIWQERMEVIEETETVTIEPPTIIVDSCPDSLDMSIENNKSKILLLSTDQNVLVKQHRSKSDSGLTPHLLPPKVYMETYSTEELHPSTTLLSLSSITNTVQLRKVYAATNVESHLICPTVFHPIDSHSEKIESDDLESNSNPLPDTCDDEICPVSVEEIEITTDNAQNSIISTCMDGCGTPSPPETRTILEMNQTKQRSQSLINNTEVMKYYSQALQNRRASDYGPYSNKHRIAQECAQVSSNTSSYSQLQQHENTDFIQHGSSESFSKSYTNQVSVSNLHENSCTNKYCSTNCSCKNSELLNKTPSWCWHISRSFSEERPIRPSQDFDSPLPSWQVSSSSPAFNGRCGRRGSAPVVVSNVIDMCGSNLFNLGEMDSKSYKGETEGPTASGRRWSVPTETISGVEKMNVSSKVKKNDPVPVHTTRRNSCGLLESLISEHPDHALSSPQPAHSHHTTWDSRKVIKKINEHKNNKHINSDPVLLCHSCSHLLPVQRRSSLPAETFIYPECHFSTRTHNSRQNIGNEQILFPKENPKSSNPSFVLHFAQEHKTPCDLISVLTESSSMYNSKHGTINCQTISNLPCGVSENFRRRSGGLEMLSSIWTSKTSDAVVNVSIENRLEIPNRLPKERESRTANEDYMTLTKNGNYNISAIDHNLYQRRRSEPLNISLSLSSSK